MLYALCVVLVCSLESQYLISVVVVVVVVVVVAY